MAQWVKGTCCQVENQSLIPGTNMAQRENQIVLCPPINKNENRKIIKYTWFLIQKLCVLTRLPREERVIVLTLRKLFLTLGKGEY